MAPMVWNTANNEKLLIFLLASNPKIKLDFDGAAKALTNKDQLCTARAVQERLKKLKFDVMKDPKWIVMAEQAAYGHGKSKVGTAPNTSANKPGRKIAQARGAGLNKVTKQKKKAVEKRTGSEADGEDETMADED